MGENERDHLTRVDGSVVPPEHLTVVIAAAEVEAQIIVAQEQSDPRPP